MDDREIVERYFLRDESAIAESQAKYGRYCHSIAYHILYSHEDSEECVNDTWLRAWNAMPPHRPERLSAFLGKITRNLALSRYRQLTADKRGGGETVLALDELSECLPDTQGGDASDELALSEAINRFLRRLPERAMIIFLRRYFYFLSVGEIADGLSVSESLVKVTLSRTRAKFKAFLEKEGILL